MSQLIVIGGICESCGTDLSEADNFCSNCGLPSIISANPPVRVFQPQPALKIQATSPRATEIVFVPQTRLSVIDQALDSRLFVVSFILCAGPIGLPALWFSPRFSRRTKFITTGIYFLVTAILPIVAVWYCLEIFIRPVAVSLGG